MQTPGGHVDSGVRRKDRGDVAGIQTRGGHVDSGVRRKDGRDARGYRHPGLRGFRRSPERRKGCAWIQTPGATWIPAFAGKTEGMRVDADTGGRVDSGVRRKDGRDAVDADTGGRVDSGVRRKDGRDARGYRHRGVTWIPAFAGKTVGMRGYTDTGGPRGFRRSPERRGEVAGIQTRGGHVDSGVRRKDGGMSRVYRHGGGHVDSGVLRKDGRDRTPGMNPSLSAQAARAVRRNTPLRQART